MTPEKLKEISKSCPSSSWCEMYVYRLLKLSESSLDVCGVECDETCTVSHVPDTEDAKFIANSPETVKALLEYIKELEEEKESLQNTFNRTVDLAKDIVNSSFFDSTNPTSGVIKVAVNAIPKFKKGSDNV